MAEARLTIVRREIIKAVEQNRKHMYSFLEKPVSRQDKKRLRQGTEIDAFDELEKVLEENTVSSSQSMSRYLVSVWVFSKSIAACLTEVCSTDIT